MSLIGDDVSVYIEQVEDPSDTSHLAREIEILTSPAIPRIGKRLSRIISHPRGRQGIGNESKRRKPAKLCKQASWSFQTMAGSPSISKLTQSATFEGALNPSLTRKSFPRPVANTGFVSPGQTARRRAMPRTTHCSTQPRGLHWTKTDSRAPLNMGHLHLSICSPPEFR